MVTVTQFAKEFGVSRQTILEWIEKGIIKNAIKPLRAWRIPVSEIERLKAGK